MRYSWLHSHVRGQKHIRLRLEWQLLTRHKAITQLCKPAQLRETAQSGVHLHLLDLLDLPLSFSLLLQ